MAELITNMEALPITCTAKWFGKKGIFLTEKGRGLGLEGSLLVTPSQVSTCSKLALCASEFSVNCKCLIVFSRRLSMLHCRKKKNVRKTCPLKRKP